MSLLVWFLASLVIWVGIIGLGLSFYLTRRFGRGKGRTPAGYGLAYEEVTFPAADGLQLRGVWVPVPGSERAVLLLHSHGSNLDETMQHVPPLHQAGFNVFLFDFRAHGGSQGQLATFGYQERQDLLGAIEFVKARGAKRIGVLGFSYGGMVAMLTAPLCPDIHAIVSDGGPARLRSVIEARAKRWHLPRLLGRFLGWLTVAITSARLDVNLFRLEPIRWVGKIAPRPIFFIHGELDPYLPDFDALYAAAGEPKQAWRLPGVGHTHASQVQPEEYYRRVVAFFQQYL